VRNLPVFLLDFLECHDTGRPVQLLLPIAVWHVSPAVKSHRPRPIGGQIWRYAVIPALAHPDKHQCSS
jgi:hypothetical protein